MAKKSKRVTFDLENDLFYKLKVYCAENEISIKDFVTNLIKKEIIEK